MLRESRKVSENLKLWLIFLSMLFLYHLAIKIYLGDDVNTYMKVDLSELLKWLSGRYNSWSSRVLIDGLTVLLAKHIFLWKCANIAIYSLLAYSLYKLSHETSLFVVLSMTLVYPLVDMSSAGWVCTFLNYLWPLAFGLYSLSVIDKIIQGGVCGKGEIILSFLCAIISVNVEQYCAVQLAFLIFYTVVCLLKKKTNLIGVLAVHYLIAGASFCFIMTAPGNYLRKTKEVTNWMKDFYQKTAMDKLIDGFESTMSSLLSSGNIIFLIFTAVLFVMVWKATENMKYRITGALPLALCIVISVGKTDSNGFFSAFVDLIRSNIGVNAANWVKASAYLPLILYAAIVLCIVVSFFIMFENLWEALECSFVFGTAIASRVVMGFSPTLFASSNRTFIFCYFLLVLLILKMLEYRGDTFTEKELRYGKCIMTVLSIVIVLNNIVSAGNKF